MAGSISSVDFGDLNSAFNGLFSRKMNIPLLLPEDIQNYIYVNTKDEKTTTALGVNPSKNKRSDEIAIKNKLLSMIKGFDSKTLSFLVENVTIKDQENENFGIWRLRIRPDIPIYDNYVFNNQTLVFECDRKSGRLRIKKIYLQRVPPAPFPSEGLIEGRVFVIDAENTSRADYNSFISKADFDWMLQLEPRRKNLEERLEEWENYLDFSLLSVRNKQAWIAYNDIRRIDSHTAEISLSSSVYSNNAVRNYYTEDEVMILDHEKPESPNWKPDENTDDPVRFGIIKDSKPIKENINNNVKNKTEKKWFTVEIELNEKYVFDQNQQISIERNYIPKKDPLEGLPKEGLFVNSLFADELPIDLQQKAIRRLKEGSASNPRLEDFVFDINEARKPLRDEEIKRDNLVETSLNNSQLEALRTSLNSSDISLIQGPPGTGKTTVIAELCYQTVLRGGKVLLASQANLAVDNALSRLTTKKSEIMPIRIGRRTTEEGQDFVEENVVPRWFQSVKENVRKTVEENRQNIMKLENAEQAVRDLDNCFKLRVDCEKRRFEVLAELRKVKQKYEQDRLRKQEITEKKNLLEKNVSLLNDIKIKGTYPTQQDFVIFANMIPDAISLIQNKVKNLFLTAGIQIEKELDPIYMGEVLEYIAYICASNTSASSQQLEKLKELILKLDNLKNDEIKELELKRIELTNKLSSITDFEEMKSISPELVVINNKINDLKKENNNLRLGDSWREILVELRVDLKYLLDISKIVDLKDLQYQIDSLKGSLQPRKEFEATINLLIKLVRAVSSFEFKVDCTSSLEDRLSTHEADLINLATQLESLNGEIKSVNELIVKLESELDNIETKLNVIKTSVERDVTTLSSTGLLDNSVTIDEKSLGSIRSEFENQRSQQEEYIKKSKRWIKLQSEWIDRIDLASREEYDSLKETYIDLANVVGVTCTETGKHRFWGKEGRVFDLVIIDEVSKATPPELLMPMMLGKQIILVGDHQQLPPLFKISANDDELPLTEIEEENAKKILERYKNLVTTSYFKEMFEDANDLLKARLTVQYRMHPCIMNAINQFYPDGYKLECGIKDPEEKRKHGLTIKGEHGIDLSSKLSHLIWVDTGEKKIDGRIVPNFEEKESGKFSSRYNVFEVETIEKILLSFSKQLEEQDMEDNTKVHDIALISFYAGQMRLLKKMEHRLKDSGHLKNLKLKIGTVDRFQGMESPIVFVSLVSSPSKRGPTPFVKEFRRINVAFSRAQSLLVVVGSEKKFSGVTVEIDYDGEKRPRNSYDEIINAAKSCSSGNYFVKGYDIYE